MGDMKSIHGLPVGTYLVNRYDSETNNWEIAQLKGSKVLAVWSVDEGLYDQDFLWSPSTPMWDFACEPGTHASDAIEAFLVATQLLPEPPLEMLEELL